MKKSELQIFLLSSYKLSLTIALILITTSLTLSAAETWDGSNNSDWSNSENWIESNIPGTKDNALIPSGCLYYPVIVEGDYIVLKSLTIESGGSITMDGGILEISKSIKNYGDFTQNSGSIVTDKLEVKEGGSFAINDGTLLVNKSLKVDESTFTQDGGIVSAKDIKVKNDAVYTQLTGELNIDHDFKIPSDGTFISTAGTVHFTGKAGGGADYIGYVQFNDILIDDGANPKFDNDGGPAVFISGDYTNNNPDLRVKKATFIFNGTDTQSIFSASSYSNSTFGVVIIEAQSSVEMLTDLEIEIEITKDGTLEQNGNTLYVGGIPNPVELTSFSGSTFKNGIQLKWETATEVNNYGFSIERKSGIENSEWQEISFVEGHGNSYSPKQYSFYDSSPIKGKASYRLKQIDTDGIFEYFNEVEISFLNSNKVKLLQNHPNPFNPSTVISFSLPQLSHVSLTVYNAIGEEVMTLINDQLDAGFHNVNFDGSYLSSGFYFYSLQTPNYSKTMKMILIK